MALNPMAFVTDFHPQGPIADMGGGFLRGMQNIQGQRRWQAEDARANRYADSQMAESSERLSEKKRAQKDLEDKQREELISTFEEAVRRGDKQTIKAVRGQLERYGIQVSGGDDTPSELGPPPGAPPGTIDDDTDEGVPPGAEVIDIGDIDSYDAKSAGVDNERRRRFSAGDLGPPPGAPPGTVTTEPTEEERRRRFDAPSTSAPYIRGVVPQEGLPSPSSHGGLELLSSDAEKRRQFTEGFSDAEKRRRFSAPAEADFDGAVPSIDDFQQPGRMTDAEKRRRFSAPGSSETLKDRVGGGLELLADRGGSSGRANGRTKPTRQPFRLIDRSTGKVLAELGDEDTGTAAGNVGGVFEPLIRDARTPEHARAAQMASEAAQRLAPMFGEAKAIEIGQGLYRDEASRIDKITAGRGSRGLGGSGPNVGVSGYGKVDFQQSKEGDAAVETVVQHAQQNFLGADAIKAERTLRGGIELLNKPGGTEQRTARAELRKYLTGVAANKTEMREAGAGEGLLNQVDNYIRELDNGTLTPQSIDALKSTFSTIYEQITHSRRRAGDRAYDTVSHMSQFGDHTERLGRAAIAYHNVTGTYRDADMEAQANAWEGSLEGRAGRGSKKGGALGRARARGH